MSDQKPPVNSDTAEQTAEVLSLQKPLSRRTLLKIGGTIATAAVAAPILAACGDATATTAPASTTAPAASATTAAAGAATTAASSSGGGTLLVYWNAGHNYKTYQGVISQFEKDHPGWKVQFEAYQWPDMRTKILANFQAGNVPDLMEEPGGWIPEFGLQGKLLSLKPYIEADGKAMGFPADWQPYTVSRSTLNGEVYGVQLHLTNILLFYNKDMFSKAGIANPPATWEEFLTTAKALTQGSVFGFAANQDTNYAWPWLLQSGAHWVADDKKTLVLDSPEGIEAMQFQADLIYKHKVSPIPAAAASYEGPQKLFSAKRAAMILTGPWDVKPIKDGSPDLNFGIAPALTHKVQATQAAGTSLMIPKGAKNPDLAWDFIKRITALDVEVAATKEANMTMPRLAWGQNADVQANPIVAPFAKGLAYAKDSSVELALTGKQTQIQPLYDKMYQDIIYKNTPASDALKAFVAAGNKILAGQ
jgi:multiple sugar transport system substrate-binding protein